MKPPSISDYRAAARRKLPRFLFDYVDGGSYGEVTLRRNVADLEAVALRQRVLRDVSAIDLSTILFGQRQAMPIALAPVGLNAVVLVATGIAFHRLSRRNYPHRAVPVPPPIAGERVLARADIDAALADMHDSFDISRDDLDALLQLAEHHAAERQVKG